MKNLWSSSLASQLQAGAAQMLKGAVNAAQQQGSEAASSSDAAAPKPSAEKSYLRLPLESARRLRWFDKVDLQAITKSHLQEKRELQDTIMALKKALIRSGTTEGELEQDLELSHLLTRAADISESDAGVHEVLLVSLQEQHRLLQEEAALLREQLELARSAAARAPPAAVPLAAAPQLDAQLAASLQQCVAALEASTAAAAASQRQVKAAEIELCVAQATDAMMLQMAQQHNLGAAATRHQRLSRQSSETGHAPASATVTADADGWEHADGSNGDAATADGSGSDVPGSLGTLSAQHMQLLAKVQRAEMERRMLADEVSELSARLRGEAAVAAAEADALRRALGAADERCDALAATVEGLQAELATAKAATRAAEEAAKRLQGSAEGNRDGELPAHIVRRYQDICVAADERATAMERRAALAEARGAKAEAAVKEGQATIKTLQKQLATAQAEQQEAAKEVERLLAAQVAAAAAPAPTAAAAAAAAATQLETLEQQVSDLQRELTSSRAALASAQQRLQAADVREAQLMAELRELDLVASEREQLGVQVAALREKLAEQRSERGQLEHFRQVVRELEAGRNQTQEELVVTAQLVTHLETKLRDALRRSDQAETGAQMAESRAHQAEASIAREVELRLAAACSNRALWPPPIREEFERLEQRLSSLQVSLVAAQGRLEADGEALKAEASAREAAVRRVAELDSKVGDIEFELDRRRDELHDKEEELARVTGELANVRREKEDLARQLKAASTVFMRQSTSTTGGDTHPKWQVQNKVGGGSLYGVADERGGSGSTSASPAQAASTAEERMGRRGSAASSSSGSMGGDAAAAVAAAAAHRSKMEGVDIVYLKNVLLKFMEAAMTGKVQEREVLLPAVAALLQASPAEFQILRRLVTNTAPPGVQMLSALGIKMS